MSQEWPGRVGPYEIIKPIGSGGMGEVFLGEDVNLGRKVALKRIRMDKTNNEYDSRFKREARLSARLQHPNLVQIYGLEVHEDHYYLIMEYADGGSLKQLLAGQPMTMAQIIGYAYQLLRGIAAIHKAGIVHRDLKPANILIHDDSIAKIADFGIARDLLRSPEDGTQTATGMVLGSLGYMSPEQAVGQKIDHRSDLFSLGSILYKLAVGQGPFEADSQSEAIAAVINRDPVPPHAVVPDLSPELSALILHLLQKDPDLRPGSAAAVLERLDLITGSQRQDDFSLTLESTEAVTLERLPTSSTLAGEQAPSPKKKWTLPLTIAVITVVVILGFRQVDILNHREVSSFPRTILVAMPVLEGDFVSEVDPRLMVRDLALELSLTSEELDTVDPALLRQTDGSLLERALAVGANEILASDIQCGTDGCSISLRRLGAERGQVLASETLAMPPETLALRDAVNAALARLYDLENPGRTLIHKDDYEAYLNLLELEYTDKETVQNLVDQAKHLRSRATDYASLYFLELRLLRKLARGDRNADYQKRHTRLLAKARVRFPMDYRFHVAAVEAGILEKDAGAARLMLTVLEGLRPDLVVLGSLRAKTLELEGKPHAALAEMERAVQRSRSYANLFNLAKMESYHGSMDRARTLLNEVEQLVPKSKNIKRLAAQWALLYGSPEDAVQRYEVLVAQGKDIGQQVNLGLAYMLTGRYTDALAEVEKVVKVIPDHPLILLNFADMHYLAGQTQKAGEVYRQIITLTESEEDDWQVLGARSQAYAHLNDPVLALSSLQKAQKLVSDPAQMAYESALIHALVGEQTSALLHAKTALKAGYSRAWFGFPWFDSIRDELLNTGA